MATKKIKTTIKKPVKKAVSAVAKKPTVKKTVKINPVSKSTASVKQSDEVKSEVKVGKGNLQAQVVDVSGKPAGKINLPVEIFGVNVNKTLITQAIRVYLANQREGSASTKTRGEVEGSTHKIYNQKGTGRARHGGIRAPIFVGGGIAFGPRPRDYSLEMPKKMRRVAMVGALTSQYQAGNVVFVDGLTQIEPKTKIMAKVLTDIGVTGTALILTAGDAQTVKRAGGNLAKVDIIPATSVNAYVITSHQKIVIMKEAVESMKVSNK